MSKRKSKENCFYSKGNSLHTVKNIKHADELINETIDYPIMIIEYDESELRFNLLSSNLYGKTQLKLINNQALKYLMR